MGTRLLIAALLLAPWSIAAGDSHNILNQGLAILEGRVTSSGGSADGIALLKEAALMGNAEAALHLGLAYDFGQGVAEDDARAADWYRRGAAGGDVHAQTALGTAFRYGRGVATDNAKAARWYRIAAAQGFAEAQYYLAKMMLDGKAAAEDGEDPRELLRAAAAQGHVKAARALARLAE